MLRKFFSLLEDERKESYERNCTHVKFYVELVLQEILNMPALAEPSGTFFIRFKPEPVVIRFFIVFDILQ